MCMCACLCVGFHRSSRSSGAEDIGCYEVSGLGAGANSDLLQEQHMLLTAELCLQLSHPLF